jgi:bifunctional non-homologous end joining protein LigD
MPASAEVLSVSWLFEPFWPGDRIVVRLDAIDGTAWDARGAALPDAPEMAGRIGAALDAERATLDAVRTESAGVVLVDLLELDGEPLLDVPFQERRRLLESVVTASEAVHPGPLVKHPVDRWLATWRADGFRHYVAKHQNAPYRPGQQTEDWLKITLDPDAGGGFLGHLVGSRRSRSIRD